jgi:acyl-CoA reductase-like NAD-dependent aldehyde dehydrogenase
MGSGIFEGAFQNSGQVCLAIKRLYVHESVYDELCNELVAIAKNTVVDDGSKQGTKLGPLQNKMQYEKVKAFLEDARKNGKVVAGGSAMDRPGYFIEPTIVRDIKEGSRLVDEEQFGPVLPLIKYSDKDDVIRRANATTYGLGASVWSSDTKRAHEVASRIEAGTVWINEHLDWPRIFRSAAPSSPVSAPSSPRRVWPSLPSSRSSTARAQAPEQIIMSGIAAVTSRSPLFSKERAGHV